ncbi:MAG: cysteine peptidase family C39 domain-containing protein [Armatimonadota bacterium]
MPRPLRSHTPTFREDPNFAAHPEYRAAMELGRSGEYLPAAAKLAVLADAEPRSSVGAWSRYQQALALRTAGREEEARKVFTLAVREYGDVHQGALAREALAPKTETAVPQRPTRDPDCGPKCLLRACELVGIDATLPEIVRLAKPGPRGATLNALAEAAKTKGLQAQGLSVPAAGVEQLPLPAIAWVDRNHYVLLTEIRGGTVRYYDPARPDELLTSPLPAFRKRWDGYALALSRAGAD